MKKIAFTFAALACVASTWADEPVADGQWRGLASASLAVTSGNSQSQAALASVDLARLTTQDKISLGGYVNEGRSKSNGVTTTSSGKEGVHGQYDYNLTPEVFGFGSLAFDHDRVLDLSLRSLAAAGLGYHVIKTKATQFDVFGGLSYSDTRYNQDETIGGSTKRDFTSTGLLLGEESSHQLTDSVSAKQRLEYYPGLTGDKAQLLKFNAMLNVSMTKTLALSVGLIDTYNSKVAAGQKSNDMALFTGISMKLGN